MLEGLVAQQVGEGSSNATLKANADKISPGFPESTNDKIQIYMQLSDCSSSGPTCRTHRLSTANCVNGWATEHHFLKNGTINTSNYYAPWIDVRC